MSSGGARWVVLFDWDGTLIDSLDLKVHNAGELFRQAYGLSHADVEAAYRRHSGIPRRQLFDAICTDHNLSPLQEAQFIPLSERFTQMNRLAILQTSPEKLLFPDTVSTLQTLEALAFPLFVSSSADSAEIQDIALALGLEGFFKRTGGEILGSLPGFSKGKQHVEYALRKLGASPSVPSNNDRTWKVVVIGDEPLDIILGRQAGAITIARTGTYPASRLAQEDPDYIIQTLGELPQILTRDA